MRANSVNFVTADDYPSSIDMATAYAGETLIDPFGFPSRLRMSTKLG